MRSGDVALLVGAASCVVAVEVVSTSPSESPLLAVADGLVALVALAASVVARRRRPDARTGAVMALLGVTWLAGAAWPALSTVHRGPLVQLTVSSRRGRVVGTAARVTVVAAYVTGLSPSLANKGWTQLGLALAVGLIGVTEPLRRSRPTRTAASTIVALILGFAAIDRVAHWHADRLALLLYDLGVGAVILLVLADLLSSRAGRPGITELVVALGRDSGPGAIDRALAAAVGDPTIAVGYWSSDTGGYLDDRGEPLTQDIPDGSVASAIDDGPDPMAVVIHRRASLDDPEVVETIRAALRLATSNVAMQLSTRQRVDELAASRRRIIHTIEAERDELEHAVRDRVEPLLDVVADTLADLDRQVSEPLVRQLRDEVDAARTDLGAFARGLHPRSLEDEGLGAALRALPTVRRASTTMNVPDERFDREIETAVYFVCVEALTNIAKHAHAQHIHVDVTADDGVIAATIEDDGSGSADASRGSGLHGIADRVASVGGCLQIDTGPKGGTRVRAVIPINRDTASSSAHTTI